MTIEKIKEQVAEIITQRGYDFYSDYDGVDVIYVITIGDYVLYLSLNFNENNEVFFDFYADFDEFYTRDYLMDISQFNNDEFAENFDSEVNYLNELQIKIEIIRIKIRELVGLIGEVGYLPERFLDIHIDY